MLVKLLALCLNLSVVEKCGQLLWIAQSHNMAFAKQVRLPTRMAKAVPKEQTKTQPKWGVQYANYWAPLTGKRHTSTAPAHQPLGSANAETTPAGAPAAAADRTQRPDATCEGKTG